MLVIDILVAHMMALCVSASLIVFFFKFAAGEKPMALTPPSEFSVLDDLEYPDSRIKVSAYVTVLLLGLLVVTASSRAKKQRLVPGIPIVGGNSSQDVKRNRTRFVHDGKAMLDEGYRQVRRKDLKEELVVSDLLNIQSGDRLFYIPSNCGERLMLPVKYLEDLKTSPVDKVDFVATFIEVLRYCCRPSID